MNYQIILGLLATKFTKVRKDGLEQVARLLALQCSNEDEAQALIEKITEEQVTDYVKEFRSVVDREATNARKSFEENLRKKYQLVERKGEGQEDEPARDKGKDNAQDSADIASLIARAVAEAVKPLQEQLEENKRGETAKSRLQSLQEKLQECKDENFRAQSLKDFARMAFNSDEDFNDYLTAKQEDIKAVNQSVADGYLGGQAHPITRHNTKEGVSKAVADYVASKSQEGNTLKGKEL